MRNKAEDYSEQESGNPITRSIVVIDLRFHVRKVQWSVRGNKGILMNRKDCKQMQSDLKDFLLNFIDLSKKIFILNLRFLDPPDQVPFFDHKAHLGSTR